jgi:CheY-like chemotaxis protein
MSPSEPCILLVDDDPDGREMMAVLLELNGHVVKQAADAQTALALARECDPALVLMDLTMPEVDGYEAARRLKGDARTAEAILIALSGRVFPDDVRRAFAAGFEGFLAKPIDAEKTQQVIAALMRDGRAALPLLLLLPRQPIS